MAFKLKQENYTRKPSADMRRILRFCRLEVPATRIDAHLALKQFGMTDQGKAKLREWKALPREERLKKPYA